MNNNEIIWSDLLLNKLINHGKIIKINNCLGYIFDVTIRCLGYEYYIKINYLNDNIFLESYTNKVGEIYYGCADAVISRKIYKKFLQFCQKHVRITESKQSKIFNQ